MSQNTEFGTNTNPSNFITAGKFDLNKFNAAFEQHKYDVSLTRKLEDEKTLSQLNAQKTAKPISEYNLLDILIGTKNAWFGILDDLLDQINKLLEMKKIKFAESMNVKKIIENKKFESHFIENFK